jgi:hypothetical protein
MGGRRGANIHPITDNEVFSFFTSIYRISKSIHNNIFSIEIGILHGKESAPPQHSLEFQKLFKTSLNI